MHNFQPRTETIIVVLSKISHTYPPTMSNALPDRVQISFCHFLPKLKISFDLPSKLGTVLQVLS
jgi:hypothetical protein